MTLVLNGAQRLYQLFKNIVLMSLIRQRKAAVTDSISQGLFKTLAEASMREAPEGSLCIYLDTMRRLFQHYEKFSRRQWHMHNQVDLKR